MKGSYPKKSQHVTRDLQHGSAKREGKLSAFLGIKINPKSQVNAKIMETKVVKMFQTNLYFL